MLVIPTNKSVCVWCWTPHFYVYESLPKLVVFPTIVKLTYAEFYLLQNLFPQVIFFCHRSRFNVLSEGLHWRGQSEYPDIGLNWSWRHSACPERILIVQSGWRALENCPSWTNENHAWNLPLCKGRQIENKIYFMAFIHQKYGPSFNAIPIPWLFN